MRYQKTLDYLFSQLPMFQRIGAAAYKANLDNTLALCELTGHPQNSFKAIHVAGTNGKGSVSHMIASIMQENNLKTALFTSPHLSDFRERIKIDGKMIDKDFIVEFVEKYKADFEKIKPSFFEMTFALAMCWFKENNVDIAVIETGMGGRLDSTNVITPIISIITNISPDHTQFLGKTLEAIAHEKAGIIKPGIPVVIGETNPVTAPVFMEKATLNQSPLFFADKLVKVIAESTPQEEARMNVTALVHGFSLKFSSPMTGHYQIKNIATVVAAMEALKSTYPDFEALSLREGINNTIKNTGLKGRWQILNNKPLTICDIAHNSDGITQIVSQLSRMNYNKLHFVFGMVNDKDVEEILKLLPGDATYYFCKADIPRGLDANELKTMAEDKGLHGDTYSSVKQALMAAENAALSKDLIFIGGSAFVVAEIV
ncbi:MAG: folylpolyglutamate synthase/dihydrofolate synthase family protein [Lentimicrobium sp.]|jgi:dihydrofolate synthase/folylpolyglutamate synthase|nr:folylpolyglutamate synthase/dihydrofolate synthase family protein [Lentimicrobium sp.]